MNNTAIMTSGKKNNRRSNGRFFAVQALYQLDQSEYSKTDIDKITTQFNRQTLTGIDPGLINYLPADNSLIRFVIDKYNNNKKAIDDTLARFLPESWPLNRLDATLRAILRAATVELLYRFDIPSKVTINEYLNIGHAFFASDEMKIINGVLDKVAREVDDKVQLDKHYHEDKQIKE